MGGFICFSWKAFLEGNAIDNDKINLGLHEFAHALRFNGIRGNETDYFFENYFARWLACAYSEFKKLQHNPCHLYTSTYVLQAFQRRKPFTFLFRGAQRRNGTHNKPTLNSKKCS